MSTAMLPVWWNLETLGCPTIGLFVSMTRHPDHELLPSSENGGGYGSVDLESYV